MDKKRLAVLLTSVLLVLTACGARGKEAEDESFIPAIPELKGVVGGEAIVPEQLMEVSQQIDSTELSETGEMCLRIAPGTPYLDVTIPDGLVVEPGIRMTKVWRIKNSGTCTWSPEFQLVWFSGANLGTTNAIYLSKTVSPGEMVDIAVDIQIPNQAGIYQSNWKLMTPQGELFGLGANSEAPIWVIVEVQGQEMTSVLPTVSVTPVPPVLVEGSVILTPGDTFDFDTGALNPLQGADVTLVEDLSLTLLNDTQRSYARNEMPGFSDCRNPEWLVNQIVEDGLETRYYCYRSSQGLPGYLRITHVDASAGTIEFEFFTWALP